MDQLLSWLKRELGDELRIDLASLLEIEEELTPIHSGREPRRSGRRKRVVTADQCWVPPGKQVEIHGRTVRGGMIYVGTGLPAVSRYEGPEPALIDPKLPVVNAPDSEWGDFGLRYWASYYRFSPSARASYLDWLAGGRCDPEVHPRFPLLFFYGLERRLLADGAWGDAEAITAEVDRLLSAYGARSYTLKDHATRFLDTVKLLRTNTDRRAYEDDPPRGPGWTFPTRLLIGLGQLAVDGKPVPPRWAFEWLRADSDTRFRTAANRCPGEFEKLFLIRYGEEWGDGIKVRPNKKRLKAHYYPASVSFGGGFTLPLEDLPDVSALHVPVRKLQALADACCEELGAYSRWIGRNPEGGGTLAAAALLPADLLDDAADGEVAKLYAWAEERLGAAPHILIRGGELAAFWNPGAPGKLAKGEAGALAQLLGRRGYGFEPDPRFGGSPVGDGPLALFRAPSGTAMGDARPVEEIRTYNQARLLAQLAVAVAGAEGEPDAETGRRLWPLLDAAVSAPPAEKPRIRAHLAWRIASGVRIAGVKAQAVTFDPAHKQKVGRFLVAVAASDGGVSPAEVKQLERLYRLIGLPSGDVYGAIHAHAASGSAAMEPVVVRAAGDASNGYAIPHQPAPQEPELVLDDARVREKLEGSAAVSALLGSIFAEEDEGSAAASRVPGRAASGGERPGAVGGGAAGTGRKKAGTRRAGPAERAAEALDLPLVAGLDAPHSSLLRALAARPEWRREELEALAAERGLLPDGALDTINEAALDACGDPACDGDDPIQMNAQVLEEMLP